MESRKPTGDMDPGTQEGSDVTNEQSDANQASVCPHCGAETRRVGHTLGGEAHVDVLCANGHTLAHDVAGVDRGRGLATDGGESELKKFPKVRPLGHPETEQLEEDGTVFALEKMDGANFRFARDGDRILFGSRNCVYKNEKDIPNAFEHAVEYVRDHVDAEDLRDDVTYFAEAMHSHTLDYDWDDVPSVLGFACYDHEAERFRRWRDTFEEFGHIGIPAVPVVECLQPEALTADYPIPESRYRDGKAEGVVFWHENGTCAKLRSEEFREKHKGNTSGPEDHEPSEGHEVLVETYCTETRIDKRIDDLLDEGHDLGRELMGEGLPQAVSRDVLEEHAHEIVGLNETVDLKEYRSLVAKQCLARIDDRMRENVGGSEPEPLPDGGRTQAHTIDGGGPMPSWHRDAAFGPRPEASRFEAAFIQLLFWPALLGGAALGWLSRLRERLTGGER